MVHKAIPRLEIISPEVKRQVLGKVTDKKILIAPARSQGHKYCCRLLHIPGCPKMALHVLLLINIFRKVNVNYQ